MKRQIRFVVNKCGRMAAGFIFILNMVAGELSSAEAQPGSLDIGFKNTLGDATGCDVNSFIVLTNGNIVILGRLLGYPSFADLWEIDSQGNYLKLIGGYSSPPSYAVQPDGRILISYPFNLGTRWIYNLDRLEADGRAAVTLGGVNPFYQLGIDYELWCMGVQKDSKIITGGHLKSYAPGAVDQRYSRLTRLNTDGTEDKSFYVGQNKVESITSIFIQPDDRILILGDFTQIDGLARTNLARLNADGSGDASFDAGNSAITGNIRTLLLDSDQRILIGGDFTRIQGVTRNHIARLMPNGQLDASFDPGSGPDNSVYCLAQQSDGKIWLSGLFTNVDGFFSSHIARLNPDGSRDSNFYPGTGAGPDPYPTYHPSFQYSIALQPNGDALFGGYFSSYDGVPCNGLVRIHGDAAQPALRLTEPGLSNGNFIFKFEGNEGTRYDVQTSTNLLDWQTVTNGQQTGSFMLMTNRVPDNVTQLYYRVKSE